MKKLTILKFLVLMLSMVFILASCSKEARFEKRIDGTWNIAKLSNQTYEDGKLTDDYTFNDIGTITFEKDGTGEMTVILFGTSTSESFTWTATSTHISIDGDPMEIIENKKKTQVWTSDETEVVGGVTTREVSSITLEKQ